MLYVSKRTTLGAPTQFPSITDGMNLASENNLLSLWNALVTPIFCQLMVIFLQNPLQNEIGILFPQRLFVRHIEGKASKQAVFACFLSLIEQNVDTFFVLFEVLHHRRELLLISYLIDNQLYRGNNSYLSVPVPVVPIDFFAIQKPSFIYNYLYIN